MSRDTYPSKHPDRKPPSQEPQGAGFLANKPPGHRAPQSEASPKEFTKRQMADGTWEDT